ncbi:hypothetical protein [Cohnella soli]|uniref:Uncharacterized protein n=1 Tax=Cohnella soli TaxID=425005 RepID=A0ABW0HZ09_9BACL
MEQLISFLTHNFYFVFIVIGIIYSMFFRKSPLERPRNRMPDFGSGGAHSAPARPRPPAQHGEQTQASQPRPYAQHGEQTQASQPRPYAQHGERTQASQPRPHAQHRGQAQASQPPAPRQQPRPERVSSPADVYVSQSLPAVKPVAASESQPVSQVRLQQQRATSSAGAFSRQDMKRAIVWAEIVGPPRARKPYGK